MASLILTSNIPYALLILALAATAALASSDFAKCAVKLRSLSNDSQFIWRGEPRGLLEKGGAAGVRLYTYKGCLVQCGRGYDLYPWEKISDTITTWVLSSIGLLLQAPYESNGRKWKNLYLTIRWIGSPIASLTCTMWNIRVSAYLLFFGRLGGLADGCQITGKCALLVDMATGYEALDTPSASEGLSGTPSTSSPPAQGGDNQSVFEQIRDSFYLLSVVNQFTFHDDGSLEQILRFALFDPSPTTVGLRRTLAAKFRRQRRRGVVQVLITLLWFLVVLLISIQRAFSRLGENATAHDMALGLLLGWFPVLVASTVVDRNPTDSKFTAEKINSFLEKVQDNNPTMFRISEPDLPRKDVFLEFTGQGRKRWHYGAAHGILGALENEHISKYGRNWYHLYQDGKLCDGGVGGLDEDSTLNYFDFEQLWQAAFSLILLFSSCFGAFWISYNTPTVGLGCRSGGYMIFGLLSLLCFVLEFGTWKFIKQCHRRDRLVLSFDLLLTIFETFNAAWLVYIIVAQTMGLYNTCECQASIWGRRGGYIDMEVGTSYYQKFGVNYNWTEGSVIGMLSICAGLAYVLEQWLTQSFLWAAKSEDAKEGLRVTRAWKRRTFWVKVVWGVVDRAVFGGLGWGLRVLRRRGNWELERGTVSWEMREREVAVPEDTDVESDESENEVVVPADTDVESEENEIFAGGG